MTEISDQTIEVLFRNKYFLSELSRHIETSNARIKQNDKEEDHCSVHELVSEINNELITSLQEEVYKINKEMENSIIDRNQVVLISTKKQINNIKNQLEDLIQHKLKETIKYIHSSYPEEIPKLQLRDETAKRKKVKENRKLLTESILQYSYIEGKDRFVDEPNQYELSQNIENNETQIMRQQSQHLKQKVNEIEGQMKRMIEQGTMKHIGLNEKIEGIYGKMVTMREEVTDKVESSLGGIWNVVSNLQQQFIKLQTRCRKYK